MRRRHRPDRLLGRSCRDRSSHRWRRSNCACRGLFTLGAKSKELTPFRYAAAINQTIKAPTAR
jgi:hypothetical protein